MAAEWVDVTGPEFWENDESVAWASVESNPVTWNGSAWVWESNFQRKEFVWVGPAGVVAEKLRLTYTMSAPDEKRVYVYSDDGWLVQTFSNYTAIIPTSGTELPLDVPTAITGLKISLRYSAGLLTKIELFMEPFGPPPPVCWWTTKIRTVEECD